ncbi:MAG TPA: hypothetical protein VGS03_13120 [Candidatus Polarisedimenticolia bacterium]|nr:hypothetical protein [Candidatus Polarisedimenticolia bacterium]
MRRLVRGIPASLAAACLLLTGPAQAASTQCLKNTFTQWTSVTGSSSPASAPVTDTAFSPVAGRSRSYVTQGTVLLSYYNANYPQGCTPGTGNVCAPTGGTCSRLKGCPASWTNALPLGAPTVAPSSVGGNLYVFVGSQDGRLYKIDVSGETPSPLISVDTRRPSCSSDRISGSPAVQIYAFSNSTFRNEVDTHPGHAHDDVVMVATSNGCGDLTHNRVIAYWASDLSVKWIFNAPTVAGDETGATRMGAAGDCFLDSASNRLYCGTEAPAGSAQDSLWAFSTLNGQLLWSDYPGGAVLNRPMLNTNNNRLYVVSRPGSLWAYDPAGNGLGGPSRLWTSGLNVATAGATVVRSPWVEPRSGTFKDKILALDSLGKLFAVQDEGTSGALLWTASSPDAGRWVSTPAVLPGPTESRAFIGRSDGFLQMVKLDGGQPQGILQISLTATDVYDPVLDTDPGSTVLNKLIVVGGSTAAGVTVPICANPPIGGAFACNCVDGRVCGTGMAGDPFRCCDASKDSCSGVASNNPCKPLRCSTRPTCCAFLGLDCTSDSDCGGRPGSCDLGAGFCTAPCPASINGTCTGPSLTCQPYSGALYQVPDDTPCSDGRACTTAEPPPTLVDCGPGIGGASCTKDRSASDLVDNTGDCPLSAPICSGSNSTLGGQGGAITGGQCCPQGTACDLATNTCRGNFGGAASSQDVCRNGACSSDDYSTCSCVNPGDRACPPDATCCGSSNGGCVNLDDAPQHCGSCGNDCGDYTLSNTSCTGDSQCGLCATDADCAPFGGKCVDGTCGKCRANPAGGALVCHRLTNRGVCTAGVCTSGAACVGPDASELMSAASLQPGLDALDFEFTCEPDGSSRCRGYATDYRTDGASALLQIDDHAVVTAYSRVPPDANLLNGVAVSRDGSQLVASVVNDVGAVPGLALRSGSFYSKVKTALGTGGVDDQPFDQVQFNRGPVGPTLDFVPSVGPTSTKAWFGNFQCPAAPTDGICTCTDLGLCKLDFSNGLNWTAVPEPYCNQACSGTGLCDYPSGSACPGAAERITALALDQRTIAPATAFHRYLVVAHGTILSFVDLDGGAPRQRDVNLALTSRYNPDPNRGESTIAAVLSIAPMPYGDVIVEVRGAGDKPAPGNVKNTWLVNVNPNDRSVRDERDVQGDLKNVPPCAAAAPACPTGSVCSDKACLKTCGLCPAGFTCAGGLCHLEEEVPANFGLGAGLNAGNGRLATLPSGRLLRFVAAVNQAPAAMAEYDVTPAAPSSCNDANPCTVDGVDAGTGLCVHAPVTCDEGDACTTDTCSPATGACLHTPISCDDSNACTADSCAPLTGCQHAPIVLAEPSPAQFASNVVLQWPATPDADHWNTYRGTIPAGMLASRPAPVYDQVCYESGDALIDGATASTDAALPPVGTAFYYLVSGEQGCESALGHASSGAPIPNASPCPTPP